MAEMHALKHWVVGGEGLNLADGMVAVDFTHNHLKSHIPQIRFDLHSTILSVKERIHHHVGSSIAHMTLVLRDSSGNDICVMDDDNRMLGYYSVETGMIIHIIDNDPFSLAKNGGLEDVSQVEKFELSWDEYDKRENTLRAYKRKMLAEDPNFKFFPKKKAEDEGPPPGPESVEGAKVGDRCEVLGGRRGTVKYLGEVPEIGEGYWVGVQYDEPVGLNDGCVKGKRLFECPPKYGGVVRPHLVTVGNFPEEDLFDDEI